MEIFTIFVVWKTPVLCYEVGYPQIDLWTKGNSSDDPCEFCCQMGIDQLILKLHRNSKPGWF